MSSMMIRAATADDARRLAPKLRQADVQEIRASSGRNPLDALLYALHHSTDCRVAYDGDEPIAMFGVGPSEYRDVGYVWMLCTDRLKRHTKYLMRTAPLVLAEFHEKYPILTNYVDARNHVHLRWLHRMGCQFIHLHQTHGVELRPFWEFIHLDV